MKKPYGFAWITLAFFCVSFALHWFFGWRTFLNEHGPNAVFADFAIEALRDTFENWQSEFLQLLWQVAGLAYLYYRGSPASREGSERVEAKLDELLRRLGTPNSVIREIDERYMRK